MNLNNFNNSDFNRGRPMMVEAIWIMVQGFFSSGIPGSFWRCLLLRLFGAKVGRGVIIKPSVKVKFPWKLKMGNDVWIGEEVWIDNLEEVNIGNNVCISQGAYLCTGSHDWNKASFDLKLGKITLEDKVWIAAKAIVAPGTRVDRGAVLTLGSVATKHLDAMGVYSGNPAKLVRKRKIS